MEDLVKRLAKVRQVESRHQEYLAAIQAEIEERYGERLGRAKELLEDIRRDVGEAETALRNAALEVYEETGVKQPHPAIMVKMFKVFIYDECAALGYSRLHLPQVVKLDKKAFEKAALAIGLDFVQITDEPRAQIARDLSAYE